MGTFLLDRDPYECDVDANLTDVCPIVEKRKTGEHLAAKVVSTLKSPEERLIRVNGVQKMAIKP